MKDKSPKPSTAESLSARSADIIKQIQQKRGHKVLFFLSHQSISQTTTLRLNQILRNMDIGEKLDVIFGSDGGDLASAYKIIQVLKSYAENVTIIVPFRAKSAASLIALGCDELILCKVGELGPIDPQVMDPQTGFFVPAHSIKEALSFVNDAKDPLVKIHLTDKIPVLLVGAYRAAAQASKQYLDIIFSSKNVTNKGELVGIFTEKFLSHGHPMNREFLLEHKVSVTDIDKDQENLIYDLAEGYEIFCTSTYSENPQQDERMLVIQSDEKYIIMLGYQTLSKQI